MRYPNIKEEELKNKVAHDFFWLYDCSRIIGNVDFCVSVRQSGKGLFEQESLLWAEAKQGTSDIYKSFVQLILTIGKARTFDKNLPPAMLGAFDAERIAFIAYSDIHDIFYVNDFNWNVTPSNYETKEFQLVLEKVKSILEQKTYIFNLERDEKDLIKFIRQNFVAGKFGLTKIRIDKNNFMVIYNKWLQSVKPSISVNWEIAKKTGIIDGDFYLADLLSEENFTLKDKLFVLLKKDHYELDRKISESGMFTSTSTAFKDSQVAHTQFWNKYERPPKEEYWDYIVERRDLLVPQDVRERKGSFFTPQIWVELSQKYLTDVLGEDWQDEYYIWDCAAGTGNLLTGLTNKYNIWASTLDTQDVEVMKDRIRNGANLLEDHVFQFDFLNDEFTKLPKPLQEIVNSEEKRKKLVIYINPPYAEAGGGVGRGFKNEVSTSNKTYSNYKSILEKSSNELFAQFLVRIYSEFSNCKIGNFSTLKIINGSNFNVFRNNFLSKLVKLFIVPAYTFDNVKGEFPIGFFIWNTEIKEKIEKIEAEVFNENQEYLETKKFYFEKNNTSKINIWLNSYKKINIINSLGVLVGDSPDFQHNQSICIINNKGAGHYIYFDICSSNIFIASIYFAVRLCIEHTWINHNDQFYSPNANWDNDFQFINDCLVFMIFHNKNSFSSRFATNHWLPFTEQEVNARDKFESNFMTKFIQGKLKQEAGTELFGTTEHRTTPLEFSLEAKEVFDAGRELWRYYHAVAGNAKNATPPSRLHRDTPPKEGNFAFPPLEKRGQGEFSAPYNLNSSYNVNASLYDIREYFQGRNDKGKMNNKSDDETYMALITALRSKLKLLACKIEPKVYEYGFLKE